MVSHFKVSHLLYLFGFIWLTGLAFALFAPDPVIDKAMQNLSIETQYKLERKSKVEYQFNHSGLLGEMYTCLQERRGFSFRNPKNRQEVALSKFIELRAKQYILRMKVTGGEVYAYSIRELNDNLKVHSESEVYAVNCGLNLLNK